MPTVRRRRWRTSTTVFFIFDLIIFGFIVLKRKRISKKVIKENKNAKYGRKSAKQKVERNVRDTT